MACRYFACATPRFRTRTPGQEDPMDTAMLIGDRMEPGTETPEPILNPRTGALILDLHEASPGQVDAAVAAARAAFDAWSRTTPAERSAALLRIADRIEADA